MDALRRANDVRVRRAKLKKDLKDGRGRIEAILGAPPEYVSTAKEIDRIAEQGKVCVLELETEGALTVVDRIPDPVTIFVTAPIEELERRLHERATESPLEIGERLKVAREQLEVADRFDFRVENRDLDRAVGQLSELVRRFAVPAGTMPRQ